MNRRIRNPERLQSWFMKDRGPKPPPTDLTGITVKQCPPGEAKNAPRLSGVVGTSRTGKGGRKGSSAP